MTQIYLQNLNKPIPGLKCAKTLFFVFIIITNLCFCQQEMSSDKTSEVSSMVLQLTSTEPKPSNDTRTGVNVTRTVTGDGNKLKFKYDVDVPSIDDFYFVLALDSSGSLGFAGDEEQAGAVINAVPRFINHTIDEYPNTTFNMSIVGWDNDIDFIYPEKIKLSPIRTVRTGLHTVFGEVDEFDDPRYLYRCEESDYTNISQALRTSIDILDNNPPVDYRRNMKFILLVVGAGEYAKCDPAIITEARDKNYNIYIVGVGSFLKEESILKGGDPTEMYKDLELLCGEKDRLSTCIAQDTDLKDELFAKLNSALNTAITENVSDNVAIIESFYGYIDPDETASWEIVGVPRTQKYIKCERKIKNYDENTNTIIFQLPELVQDNVTEIIIEADFSLEGLPMTISEGSKPIIFGTSTENTQLPVFNYRWLKNDTFNFSIKLQESSINLESAPLASNPKKGSPTSPSDLPNAEPLGGGFGIMSLIILSITAAILKQNA